MDTQELKNLLKNSGKNIIIVTHKNPDGDAMGSSLGLCHILKNAGHHVQVITPNDYPTFLKWMPAEKEVWRYEWAKARSRKAIMKADLIFCLDFNDISRIESLGEDVSTSKAIKVLIDHHLTPSVNVDYLYSDDNMVATAQMIYHFAQQMELLEYLDKDAATCIYTGILTDSGEFAFPKTTAETHHVVSELMKKGVDNYAVYQHIYMSFAQSRLLLLGKSLSNMHIFEQEASVCMTLTQGELDAAGFKKGDTEGFVNYGLTIKNINVSCIFIENKSEGIIKVSLRSKGKFSVNEMARQYFNGAGHVNAAGGQLPTTDMEYAISRFKEAVDFYKEDILSSNE